MTLHLYWPDNETPPCKKPVSVFLPTAEAASRVAPSAARRGAPHRFSGFEDLGAEALHRDLWRASVLLDRLRSAKACLVEGHPTIEMKFDSIASAREFFAMIQPE